MHGPHSLQKYPFLKVKPCVPFGDSKNGFLILDLPKLDL